MKIGMVFQSFNLYEHLTVVENCMLAQTTLLKRSRQEAYDKAIKLLASVGMDKHALQYPSQLSGGQKQRVAIARTLSTDPEIILFDEPTSALDPLSIYEVETIIEKLSRQGKTMMIVTHGMEFAQEVSNRVFYMDQGEIYEDGTPDQIFNNPKRELTKEFIMQLSSMSMTIYEETHNLNTEIGKIFNFCKTKGVDDTRTMHACSLYEEYYSMSSRYVFAYDKTLYMKIEYDKNNNKLIMSFIPGSSKKWVEISDAIYNSIEYKIMVSHIKEYHEEKTDLGVGYSFSYEIK